MKNLVAKFSLGYVVLCQWLLSAFLLLGLIPWLAEATKNQNKTRAMDAMMLSVPVVLCVVASFGLIQRKRWAWFLSLLIGVGIGAFGCSSIWDASRDTQYARMEGGLLFGMGVMLLIPSVVGLILLNLPQTRKFVF